MILAQVEASRRFIGCLDHPSELVASLTALCRDKSIETAAVQGYGYLEDPVIALYSRSEKGMMAPQKLEGMYVVPLVHGSLSVGRSGTPELLLFVQGAASGRGRSKEFCGQLVSATVRQFEFRIETVDNVNLNRLQDRATGLNLWLHMVPAGMAGAQALPVLPAGEEQDDIGPQDDGDDEVSLLSGDWLDHPRLGKCYVLEVASDERVKVRLASGRTAELIMALFRLKAAGVEKGGRVYRVSMKKK